MLVIKDLNKNLGKNEVLKSLNLEVQDGSIFGLVGINGAGKSTLLRCIAGVYEPDGGSVEFDGVNTFDNADIRNHIAFVSDEAYFPFGSTIRSVKEYYKGLYDFSDEAYDKYLEMFNLKENAVINNLSKGNKRRVSLLFGLAIKPKLLLLDEAYDGLEPLIRLRFKNALTELLEDEQITVIISSHNLKELEDICDSFGILDEGHMHTYGDLLSTKQTMAKYQLAFKEEKTIEDFNNMDVMHYEKEGQVYKLVIRGDQEEITKELEEMNPLILNTLPVNFEELFIYELESREAQTHE